MTTEPIKINGTPATVAELRRLGWALVNIATQIERAAEQRDQAERLPTEKEVGEARRAALRARAAVRHYRALVAGLARRRPQPETCPNCDAELPEGCNGLFRSQGAARAE